MPRGWTVSVKLHRNEIQTIVEALAEERDRFGGRPTPLEEKLQGLLLKGDRQVSGKRN